jgi:hypothetical protein
MREAARDPGSDKFNGLCLMRLLAKESLIARRLRKLGRKKKAALSLFISGSADAP